MQNITQLRKVKRKQTTIISINRLLLSHWKRCYRIAPCKKCRDEFFDVNNPESYLATLKREYKSVDYVLRIANVYTKGKDIKEETKSFAKWFDECKKEAATEKFADWLDKCENKADNENFTKWLSEHKTTQSTEEFSKILMVGWM